MPLLSSPLKEIKPLYDVVVIGSGYGGSIAASLLARTKRANGAPLTVCLLERGKEIPVGEFPETPLKAAEEFQVNLEGKQVGKEDALYWLHAGKDISVFQGCGLGGTSLVNANVSLPPEAYVWEDKRWPKALVADLDSRLADGFTKARAMLKATPYPGEALKKYSALQKSAEYLKARVYHPAINVNFEKRLNDVGIEQPGCDSCGNCVSGCNVGAKNTLMMNYLPDAKNHGAEIFCRVRVRRIARSGERYRIYYQPVGAHRERFGAEDLFVESELVVLSAGVLGSNEILLRSKQTGLGCSDRVGHSFSGNGDVLGFAYNNDVEIDGIGFGEHDPIRTVARGPCISGIIDRRDLGIEHGHVIEEGVIPGAIAPFLTEPMRLVAELSGTDTDDGMWDSISEKAREWSSALPGGAYRGAFRNTQTFLVMAHDSANGQVQLQNENAAVSWPGVGDSAHFKYLHSQLLEATVPLGGTYVPSPTFNRAFGYGLITVHPLGGCAMSESAETGATNHKGQVYSGTSGQAVYDSFYVSDGSVLPCSVGVNPLLTISAIAERNMRLLIEERGWLLDESLTTTAARYNGRPVMPDGIHLQFTEKMAGYGSTRVLDAGAYEKSESDGKANASPCHFVLTIGTDNLDRMIADADHPGSIVGTVYAPALSSEALCVTSGIFNLFVQDPNDKNLERMRYRMQLQSVEGKHYYFEGFKLIRNEGGPTEVWSDTTTLYITIHEGDDALGPKALQGVLHISQEDFAIQLTTMDAVNPNGSTAPLAVARFGQLFAKNLWQVYARI